MSNPSLISIRRLLLRAMLALNFAVFLLALTLTTFLSSYQMIQEQDILRGMVADLMVKNLVVPLTFNDLESARTQLVEWKDTLNLPLLNAAVSDPSGTLLFALDPLSLPTAAELTGIRQNWSPFKRQSMVRTITQHQQELGRLDLIFDPQPLRNKLMKSLITLTIVFCVALVFLVILSLFFSERLARPILAMADRINDMRRFLSEGHPLPPTLRLHVDIGNQKETHHLKNGIDALLGQVALREQQNQQAHQEITRLNQDLEARVQRRTRELSDSVDQLKAAQESIVQAEKMSALGRMVAGVAHEINTPLGIAVSLASHHCEQVEQLIQDVEHQRLSRQQFQQFLEDQRQGSQLIFENLSRANRQIQSFKKVAADQSGEEKRVFDLLQYCQEIVVSMHNQLKKKKVKIRLLVEPNLKIFSYPGIFFQILSNLIVNALVHAFDQTEHPEIVLKAQLQAQPKTSHPETHTLILHFSDNGCGVKPSSVAKLFEPFFTTKRQEGGTGLGLNIVYNLVVHQLNGQIQFLEGESKGAHWLLTLPVEVP